MIHNIIGEIFSAYCDCLQWQGMRLISVVVVGEAKIGGSHKGLCVGIVVQYWRHGHVISGGQEPHECVFNV